MPRVDTKLKVFHLRASNFYGGPERQVHYHARAALRSDFQIIVGSYAESGKPPALLTQVAADRIPTHLFEVKSAYDRRSIGLIRRYIRENDIAILCTHDYRSNILGGLAARGTATRWIAFSRGRTRENLTIRLYNEFERFAMRFADRVVAVSGGEKNSLRRRLIPDRKIAVIHNAIDIAALGQTTPVNLKSRFSLPANALVAVAAGRFSPEKGQLFLVRAAAKAVDRVNDLYFVLFGDGPDLDLVRREIESLGLKNRILCPGFEQNMAGCIRAADLLVNPSLSEGLPNVVLEAMALCTPVVATAVGGVPELVHDNKTGLLAPPADVSRLADTITRLAADPHLRRTLAENALTLVRNSFSFDKQARELIAIYRSVIDKAGRNA